MGTSQAISSLFLLSFLLMEDNTRRESAAPVLEKDLVGSGLAMAHLPRSPPGTVFSKNAVCRVVPLDAWVISPQSGTQVTEGTDGGNFWRKSVLGWIKQQEALLDINLGCHPAALSSSGKWESRSASAVRLPLGALQPRFSRWWRQENLLNCMYGAVHDSSFHLCKLGG